MELHFCSQCGISIPLTEVQSGAAVAGEDKYHCSEHRAAEAPPAPTPPAEAAEAAADDEIDLELLFCANCTISIPASDVRSGRARQEYGSMLCAVCSRSDPGQRATRRESVESEMAADVEENDPVVTHRCSVCAAVVPELHITTGQADVSGDRITCSRCRAVGAAATAPKSGISLTTLILAPLVIGGAFAIGYVATQFLQPDDTRAAAQDTKITALETSRGALESRIVELEAAQKAAAEGPTVGPAALAEVQAQAREQIQDLRAEFLALRAESTKGDADLSERLANVDGRLGSLAELVKALAARSPVGGDQRPPPPVIDPVRERPPVKTTDPPGGEDVVDAPDPEVSRLSKQLAESDDKGDRFAAATELGKLGNPTAIPPLAAALLQDKSYLVRRACARSLGSLKAWNAVPKLIDALEEEESFVAQRANDALVVITGQDFEVNQDQKRNERKRKAKAARKWWDANQDTPPADASLHPAG